MKSFFGSVGPIVCQIFWLGFELPQRAIKKFNTVFYFDHIAPCWSLQNIVKYRQKIDKMPIIPKYRRYSR